MAVLKEYQRKRKFEQTQEPKPRKAQRPLSKPLLFCVQKHAATRLHYDFRLEYRGVLLSWAIPKGPSLNPANKRLAVRVEDHPFDYRNFEGTIPKGNYGAGTVIIWDEGPYTVPGASSRKEAEKLIGEGLKKGVLDLILYGEKLKGMFVLVDLKRDNSWLLIKKKDEYSSTTKDVLKEDYSVRRKEAIKEQFDPKEAPKRQRMPKGIKPMLATLIDEPFNNKNWIFEIKWDGYRALSYLMDGKVEMRSRNNLSFNAQFPLLIEELENIGAQAILDGEIVILDKSGRSRFQLMQNYQSNREGALYYYVFDLLYLDGYDLRDLPLIERKEMLKRLLDAASLTWVRYGDHIGEKGKALFAKARKENLEGIIGKNKQSRYVSARSKEWVKIKTSLRQEAVIGGFTEPRGSRKKFGALLLGTYEKGKLRYMGHTGTGFDAKTLEKVYAQLEPLVQETCPFDKKPKTNSPATWVKPRLVCEISFSEWTKEGIARQPVFQGLRKDKKARQVKREVPEVK